MLLGSGGLTAGADSRWGTLLVEETEGLLLWLSSLVLSNEGRPLLDVEMGLSVLQVAEAGIFGSAFEAPVALGGVLRHPKLNLRRKPEAAEGGGCSASSVEDTVLIDAVSLTDLDTARGLGPIGLEESGSASWLPKVNSSGSLGGLLYLELGLGNEPERHSRLVVLTPIKGCFRSCHRSAGCFGGIALEWRCAAVGVESGIAGGVSELSGVVEVSPRRAGIGRAEPSLSTLPDRGVLRPEKKDSDFWEWALGVLDRLRAGGGAILFVVSGVALLDEGVKAGLRGVAEGERLLSRHSTKPTSIVLALFVTLTLTERRCSGCGRSVKVADRGRGCNDLAFEERVGAAKEISDAEGCGVAPCVLRALVVVMEGKQLWQELQGLFDSPFSRVLAEPKSKPSWALKILVGLDARRDGSRLGPGGLVRGNACLEIVEVDRREEVERGRRPVSVSAERARAVAEIEGETAVGPEAEVEACRSWARSNCLGGSATPSMIGRRSNLLLLFGDSNGRGPSRGTLFSFSVGLR
ncbi:hypothetical protein KCU87_g6, partial [Aureobasidium melanogenum]